MKILFFLAVWKRPEITEICFMGLNRLKKAGLCSVEFLAVISEESMKPLCKKYGVDYVMHENLPLGKKKNFGLTEAFKKNWDYIVELGSDDIIKTEVIERYMSEQKAFMSIGNFCFINSENGDCRKIESSTTYGIGRAFSRDALTFAKGVEIIAKDYLMCPGRSTAKGERGFFPLKGAKQMEQVGQVEIVGEECYKLWKDDLNRNLDNNSNFFIHRNGVFGHSLKFPEPVALDIKSEENIWAFNPEAGTPYDIDKALGGLGEDEKTAIKSLINGNRAN
jgi:hypothetical protein